MIKKFVVSFLSALILFLMPIPFVMAEELKIYPTGAVPNPVDLSHLAKNPPIFGSSDRYGEILPLKKRELPASTRIAQ